MRPKRRTKTAQNRKYRCGSSNMSSSSEDVSETEAGLRRNANISRPAGKKEKDAGFSKTKMAINMLSQNYLARESSGCEADTENSSAESGLYNFDAEAKLTLILSPTKKKKKQTHTKPNAGGKKQSKMDTENDQKLKRKFSTLAISDPENSLNPSQITEKPRQNKKHCLSVPYTGVSSDGQMDCASGVVSMNTDDIFISPISGITDLRAFKTKRFTSIKETSTPAESKPVASTSDDGCFGFDSILSPEPDVSPVRNVSTMDYITTRPSVSPTDLGSPDLKPVRKTKTRPVESKGAETFGVRRSKRISVLSSVVSLSEDMSCTDQDVVPKVLSPRKSPSPVRRRSSKRLMHPIKVARKSTRLLMLNQNSEKKKSNISKENIVPMPFSPLDKSESRSLPSMDSGIAMSFQDSIASPTSPKQEERVQRITEEAYLSLFTPEDSTNPSKRVTSKCTRTSKSAKTKSSGKSNQQFNKWASKVNDELSEIEMFDLVIST